MQQLVALPTEELFRNILSTLVLVLAVLLIRTVINKVVRRAQLPPGEYRRWIVQIRNLAVLIFIFGMIIIWAAELRTVALSFVAIAAAVVLATKELISCVTGGLLRSGAGAFSIGDRIEIGDYRGDVVDQSLLTTTIFEIGPGRNVHQYTGRAITLPNSMFLNAAVINESYTDEYVLHLFSVPMRRTENWPKAEAALLKAASEVCSEFMADATKHMERISRNRGLETPNLEPRVSIAFPSPDEIDLLVRIPAPAKRKGRVEQTILRQFLTYFNERESSSMTAANPFEDRIP